MPDHTPAPSTSRAVSPDSGLPWATEGAWRVCEGIYRIPLPLPNDGLQAVNVYVLETGSGLTLVDGGWALPEARDLLRRCLRDVGHEITDITRFLVTHVHRDHYTMASVLGAETGAEVVLGEGDRPGIELLHNYSGDPHSGFSPSLRAAGAGDLVAAWDAAVEPPEPGQWRYPDTWITGDQQLRVGERTLDAVHTPGHTPGHVVYADRADQLLFAGDHVLPTITPSIGFVLPVPADPLGSFMASLTKVRALPDLRLLPAHGPVAPSTHARVDELLAHHEHRLDACLTALGEHPTTAADVARLLPWTRRERAYDDLDTFNRGMAAMETRAHLELLVARGQVRCATTDGVEEFSRVAAPVR